MRDFEDLISSYAWTEDPARKARLTDAIWEWYGVKRTVLVTDLVGFSRQAVGEEGVLDFLAVIRRMQVMAKPTIWMHKGEIVKLEADNCFALFETAEAAAAAAFALVAAADEIRAREKLPLHICCGLESGRLLRVAPGDFFG